MSKKGDKLIIKKIIFSRNNYLMKLFVLVGDLCFLNIFRNLKTRKYFIFIFLLIT